MARPPGSPRSTLDVIYKEFIVTEKQIVDQAVAEGGTYEVIRNRLADQGKQLLGLADGLNRQRQEEFGSTDMTVTGRVRLRTENNSIARDLVRVGDYLLFGYNVNLGLKSETQVADVFGLYRLLESGDGLDIEHQEAKNSFLSDLRFVTDFTELYKYYKDTQLTQLVTKNGKLLAAFQIGERLEDLRVFRWSISPTGQVDYIDNRGERDIALPPKFDFEWQKADRDAIVQGRHSHFNVLDTLFVDSLGGDLTVKIENNTATGQGIYAEPLEETNQSLDDLDLSYARLGDMILLKIKPYLEEDYRYLVFNAQTESITRLDLLGESCVQLPEDHGLIFPGGYYLSTGEFKTFDDDFTGMKYKRRFRSPNGEDVLYVFYEANHGKVALLNYNLINKTLSNPIFGHGYGFFDDGRMALFYGEDEATRIHPLQIWTTPFYSDEYASAQPTSSSFFGKLGNAELVRGISEVYSIYRLVTQAEVSVQHYNLLSKTCGKIFDNYHWLDADQLKELSQLIKTIGETSELVLDEYEKVASMQQASLKALAEAKEDQSQLLNNIQPQSWHSAQKFVQGLTDIRRQRGHLISLKELRYMDTAQVQLLDDQLAEVETDLNEKTVEFLAKDEALAEYHEQLESFAQGSEGAKTVAELQPLIEGIQAIAEGLDLLSELMATLKVSDATLQTQIIESISELYGQLNQHKAKIDRQRKNMGSAEATAQFGAQFKLLGQSVQSALGLASSPEKCDEQLARLLVQLEELEGQFSEHDEFLNDILVKREEIYETFENQKQQLIEERQRKCQRLFDAASRILESVQRRSTSFSSEDQLNTFFASDALVQKLRQLEADLRQLDDVVKADDISSKLKGQRDQAVRTLRDKTDIYEDGGNIIKLGPRHRFSVNTTELDLTLLPRNDQQYFHLTGTDYYEKVNEPVMAELEPWWNQERVSENNLVYRGEYLAYQVIRLAKGQIQLSDSDEQWTWPNLVSWCSNSEELLERVRQYSGHQYREDYEKGIHDQDAATLLSQLVPLMDRAGDLRFSPGVRALATLYWANFQDNVECNLWPERARTALQLYGLFHDPSALDFLQQQVTEQLKEFNEQWSLPFQSSQVEQAAEYLVSELGKESISFVTTKYARSLVADFKMALESQSAWRDYQKALERQTGHIGNRWALSFSWLTGYLVAQNKNHLQRFVPEAVAILNAEQRVSRTDVEVDVQLELSGFHGDHPVFKNGQYNLVLDEFLERLHHYQVETVPRYQQLQQLRHDLVETKRNTLRLDEFKPKPLSSFVRNKLINDVYLPIIGDNLAKQMGTVGDNKRTDLMGLLLMISPPGYGKTTLMEYVASRLGLVFMKINCPSIGHEVTSVDPSQASDSTARQELEKLNMALEMGSNVMLYLDDIQHTNPEFLQKFISLCDGTRRMEGVWQGNSKTYDMRGKKFCIVMAGNPYTESGETFRIPDMLANRADVYNLGDVLGGKEEVFALSFIENSLTSNSVLAPLATRDMADVYALVNMARTGQLALNELKHNYSGAEVQEIVAVLQKMSVLQEVVLRVNEQYILSSATADAYRQEPPFKLQGSYRNMNKMAEKISAVMTEKELEQLVNDHYQGESQLLTQGAEENVLKLGEIRGTLTTDEQARWTNIKEDFLRNKAMGGPDADTGARVVAQLVDIASALENLKTDGQVSSPASPALDETLLTKLAEAAAPQVNVVNEPVPGVDQILRAVADTLENSLLPLAKIMEGKIGVDLRTHEKMAEVLQRLKQLETDQK